MTAPEEFFLREALRYSRTLVAASERSTFLRGMLMACGAIELPPELVVLIRAYVESDDQLELIASDQLKFRELLKS